MRRTICICAIWHVGEIYVYLVACCRKIAASREGLREKRIQTGTIRPTRVDHTARNMNQGDNWLRVCVHTDQHHRGSHVISP